MKQITFVTIDSQRKYQTIDHFGASGAWTLDPIGKQWNDSNKHKIADLLFSADKGIGLTVWRFNAGAGHHAAVDFIPEALHWRSYIESFKPQENDSYDWTLHEGQRWFLKAAQNRGVKQFIAVFYSPPGWMTKNGKTSPDSQSGTCNLEVGREHDYALYIADILEHFKLEEGIEFDYVSPVNEPSWEWNDSNQEGNRYCNDDIKRVVNALYKELKQRDLKTGIDIVEAAEIAAMLDNEKLKQLPGFEDSYYVGHDNENKYGGKYSEYIKDFLGDDQIAALIEHKLSYHSYFSDYAENGVDRLPLFREILAENMKASAPAGRLWQTEYCVLSKDGPIRDLTMASALNVARVIHYDLAVAGASSWQWWLSVSPHDYKDGLVYTDYSLPGDEENVLASKILWALGNYSKFIRPGAIRIDLSGANGHEGLLGSAYLHENERKVIVVFINPGETKELVRIVHLGGMSIDTWFPYVTSDEVGDDVRQLDSVQASESIAIPARSVVTLVASFK